MSFIISKVDRDNNLQFHFAEEVDLLPVVPQGGYVLYVRCARTCATWKCLDFIEAADS